MKEQMKAVYRNRLLWFFSLFYFITFGAFVAFTIYLPNFLVNHYGLTPVDSGLRTAGFIALATFIRPVGGWLADRMNPLILLMYVFAGFTLSSIVLAFSPGIEMYTVGVLTIAVCTGVGNGTIFKLVPLYFSKQAGIVNGIVVAMGGLGGFFPSLILARCIKQQDSMPSGLWPSQKWPLLALSLSSGCTFKTYETQATF